MIHNLQTVDFSRSTSDENNLPERPIFLAITLVCNEGKNINSRNSP